MMMQDKQNILKSFEGRKIDESVHVKRWGTINNSESNEDSNRMIFNKYAGIGQADSRQESASQENLFATQESQVREIDTGFKKLKNTQIEKLKELKQEYEVLRNLNIEEKPSMPSLHHKAHSSPSSSIHQSPSQQLISSSSRQKKSTIHKENISREAQILSLQKKQLEMVINNSMRKIEQLLHNEMEYKKSIHELKLQVSGRQNVDVEYEAMIKTLKKNQISQHENVEALKKENEKNKYQIRQINEKVTSLQSELVMKDQEIRLLLGEKRKSEDLVRLEKDRFLNLEIDYKKTKMEYELLEKDKNNEINRLMRQVDYSGVNRTRDLEMKVKRYEDDIEIKDKRYNVLLTQLEELRTKYTVQQQELEQFRHSQSLGGLDKDKIEQILLNFRQQNDTVAFSRQMNDVINKLQDMDHNQNDYLRQEIEMLKMELQGFKENDKQQGQSVGVQQYIERIDELERILRSETYEKEDLVAKLKRFEREFDDISRKFAQNQKEVQSYEVLESKLREEVRSLKEEVRITKIRSSSNEAVKNTREVEGKQNRELETSQRQSTRFKQQLEQLQNELRAAKRLADENDFRATKASTELEFRLKLQQDEHEAAITRLSQDMQRQHRQSTKLRQQYDQYRSTIQKKLFQRQTQLQNLRSRMRLTTDGTQSTINNLKLQYQSLLKSQRQQYKLQITQLSTQVTSLSKINEKYLQETNKYLHYENELSCLREIMRRSIHLSEGVDHLWRIKETEYQNVSEVLRQVEGWRGY